MADISRKQKLLDELAEIEVEEKRVAALTPEKQLAEALHEMTCRWNHTDGCGWYYEISNGVANWDGYAHADALKRARTVKSLLPDFDNDQIVKVAKALKGYS